MLARRIKWLTTGILVTCCFWVTGCGSGQNNGIAYQTVAKGSASASTYSLTNPTIYPTINVIRSEADWNNFWNSFVISKPMPSIDFNKNLFIAVTDLQQTTGITISINGVESSPTGITVQANEDSPGQYCAVAQNVQLPYHIILAPIFSGVASINLAHTVTNCQAP